MIRPPYTARVAAGLLATVVEETRKLPTYAVTLPMTAVSQALQAGMRLQQNVAELAIKGDTVIDGIFNQTEEQPSWAVFDEDEDAAETPATPEPAAKAKTANAPAKPAPKAQPKSTAKAPVDAQTPSDAEAPAASGRFALYSSAPDDVVSSTTAATSGNAPASSDGIVADLDYDTMTLAQLRAKIRTIELDDLRTLAAHEKDNRARAPFLTMLENRIATKSAT